MFDMVDLPHILSSPPPKLNTALNLKRGRAVIRSRRSEPRLPTRKLKPDEVTKLVADYQEGKSIDTLAHDHAIHRQTVMLHLKRQQVPRRPHQKLDEPAIQRAVELYATGQSFQRVGEQLGVDASTIAKAFHRSGIPCRPRPGTRLS